MKVKHQQSENFRMAITFFVLVIFLIFISIVFKLFVFLKDSKFDGNHDFTLAIFQTGNVEIVNFEPSAKTISILNLTNAQKNKLHVGNIGQKLEIPIDSKVENSFISIDKNNLSSQMIKIISGRGVGKSDLNFIDGLKLLLISKTIPENSITEKNLNYDETTGIEGNVMQSLFSDPSIVSEKVSIEIINGTKTYGLGNRLANLITNIGGNVVLVSNSDNPESLSKILYSGDKNYTIERISKSLGIKEIKTDRRSISDVTIIIGEDMGSSLSF